MSEPKGFPGTLIDKHFTARLNREIRPDLRPDLQVEYQNRLPQIQELYEKAAFWHGTGRFQHNPSGEDSDILGGIVKAGELSPQLDRFDFIDGDAYSISVATTRMYARNYARMFFPEGKDIENLYGEGVWSRRVAMAAAAQLLKTPGVLRKMAGDRKTINANANQWIARVTHQPHSQNTVLFKPLTIRTDIPNNYPLLFGIKEGNLVFRDTNAKYLAYERRIADPIVLSEITHIEVPYDNKEETQRFLQGHGISLPIIPLEFGEQYCRNFSFDTLMKGGPLKQPA